MKVFLDTNVLLDYPDRKNRQNMESLQSVYEAIETHGFDKQTVEIIDNYANDIQDGKTNFYRFNLSEHAGLCKAGKVLIGASIVASYATESLTASSNAEGGEGEPANWSEQGVNYISDHIALEDLHPANVFIDEVSSLPICIDCIVKFV